MWCCNYNTFLFLRAVIKQGTNELCNYFISCYIAGSDKESNMKWGDM